MPKHHARFIRDFSLPLLMTLGCLLAGAGLAPLLLPTGSLGLGEDFSVPVAHVNAAEATFSSPSFRPGEWRMTSHASAGDHPVTHAPLRFAMPARIGAPTGRLAGVAAGPSLRRTHDWRVEMQIGPAWQYAAGAGSRALRAPDYTPVGQPR